MVTEVEKNKEGSRLTKELLETADDLAKSGLLAKAEHDKIRIRHLRAAKTAPISVLTRKQTAS